MKFRYTHWISGWEEVRCAHTLGISRTSDHSNVQHCTGYRFPTSRSLSPSAPAPKPATTLIHSCFSFELCLAVLGKERPIIYVSDTNKMRSNTVCACACASTARVTYTYVRKREKRGQSRPPQDYLTPLHLEYHQLLTLQRETPRTRKNTSNKSDHFKYSTLLCLNV